MSRGAVALIVAIASSLVACAPAAQAPARDPQTALTAVLPAPPEGAGTPRSAYVRPETPDAPFRATAPPLASEAPFAPPPIQSFRLTNGVPVLLLEQHSPGFLRVEVLLRTPPAVLAANAVAARELWLGNQAMPQAKLQVALDGENAELSTSWEWGYTRVAITATSDRAASSIARLASVALTPSFSADQVVRVTRETASEQEPADEQPRSIAARVVPMALYGSPPLESEWEGLRSADIGALRRDDIAHAYEAALDPSSAALVVIGDATEKTLRPLLETSFGAWRGHAKHARTKPARLASASPRLVVVDHPGSQSLVTFSGAGPTFSSPDWAPSHVLRILFNGPKGRLTKSLNDASLPVSGASFNIGGNPIAPRVAWSAEVATLRTAETLTAIDHAMRAMKTAEIAQPELDDARKLLLSEQASWVTSITGETDLMNGLVVQDVSPSEIPKRAARVRALTADDVRRSAASYLDPDRMKVVIVGDWSKLREQLVALGWGPIEVRDSSGAVDTARSLR